jgi:hypothetical protein
MLRKINRKFISLYSCAEMKKIYTFAPSLTKRRKVIDPWCNWQHVWFWSRRVQVRALTGQLKGLPEFIKKLEINGFRLFC